VATLRPGDFERLRAKLAERYGPVALGNATTRVRVMFKYAFDFDLIDRPVKYGQGFKKPSRATLRKHRQKKGRRMFQADELRTIIDGAGVQLRAMIYLGINCGLGNNDCAMLPKKALDLKGGWLDFGQPKTGIYRRCPLWPETVVAIQATLEARPTPKDPAHGDRVFITKYGGAWEPKAITDSPVSHETTKVERRPAISAPNTGRPRSDTGRRVAENAHPYRPACAGVELRLALRFTSGFHPTHLGTRAGPADCAGYACLTDCAGYGPANGHETAHHRCETWPILVHKAPASGGRRSCRFG
jgi:hypothetical protein